MAKKKAETAAKAPAKKESKKTAAQPASEAPTINTDAAAAAAAALVGNRAVLSSGAVTARPETSMFKQMKENLNKPAGNFAGDLLGTPTGQKKSNLPFGGGKQVGRNQTFGADVNRAGVPRRTGGG